MKKLLFGMVLIAATGMSFSGSNALAAEQDCEESVNIDGEDITVTVCNRKTNFWGLLDGKKCNAASTTACTFTN